MRISDWSSDVCSSDLLTRAGELTYSVIPQLEQTLAQAEDASSKRMLKEEVNDGDIASVVSKWTGIPVDRMLEGEREKLLSMEANLHKRVIGQDEAIRSEERRGGKECVSTCRSRRSPYH